ncbi:aminotransferase [Pseudonocardia sp.]|uniref:aminotransferase n=1 Tax=Pseudonocardia sp. TaxID=60912 RepID=UPI00263263ED|nr:aminotransferase [Pseudonocardia sp.]
MRNAFGQDFDVPDAYLNTAGIGVPPVVAADAVADAVSGWRTGAGRPGSHDAAVALARSAYARLVGVAADRVAIGSTVSGLVSLAAAGLAPRSRVLVSEGEFTSLTWPLAARGHELVEAPLAEIGERAAGFDAVAVSVVQSADGAIADLDALRAARGTPSAGGGGRPGTRVLLDATQSAGWFAADLGWADAVVCAGYKWLLSPRGVAWMAVHPDWELPPEQAGWYAGEDIWSSIYGLPPRLASDARGLDTSPAWYGHAGAAVAVPWLATLDRAAVHAHCAGLGDALRAGLGRRPTGSAIVSVPAPDAARRLAAAGVACSERAGAARLAFGLYCTADDVAAALNALT